MRHRRNAACAASLAALLALALPPHSAFADPVAHLAWDDCGSAGEAIKAFACNTNVGAEQLVLSFVPPAGFMAFSGIEAVLQLAWPAEDHGAPIPPWWTMYAGGCRPSSLSGPVGAPSGSHACTDPWIGMVGGGAQMQATGGTIKAVAGFAAGSEPALDPALEYYGLRFAINHAKSIVPGACDGCAGPATIALASLKLHQDPSGLNDYTYPTFRSTGIVTFASWQCTGQPILYFDFRTGWELLGWEFPGCPTPANRTTWGQIKSLYR